jgi:hypothetical protein
MIHTVTVNSRIFSTDDSQTQRADFKLPITEFRSISAVQLPCVLNYIVDADSSYTVDLTQFGTKMRMLAIKSTRPIYLSLETADVTYTYPPMTFFHQLVNSPEDLAPLVTSLTVTVPPAASTPISGAPPRYPRAFVEMFVLYE